MSVLALTEFMDFMMNVSKRVLIDFIYFKIITMYPFASILVPTFHSSFQVNDDTISNCGKHSQTVLTACRSLQSSMRRFSAVTEVSISPLLACALHLLHFAFSPQSAKEMTES